MDYTSLFILVWNSFFDLSLYFSFEVFGPIIIQNTLLTYQNQLVIGFKPFSCYLLKNLVNYLKFDNQKSTDLNLSLKDIFFKQSF